MPMIRVGLGYDVHKLVPERDLMIGGVKLDFHLGLLGHSDADVLIHAMMDAILGALGEGDIGKHFPDMDMAYKDIDSKVLLKRVVATMKEAGYRLNQIDGTIMAQRPKMAPHIDTMKEVLAPILQVPTTAINIKATTTEGLGFVGREEGIAAMAVCSLAKLEKGGKNVSIR